MTVGIDIFRATIARIGRRLAFGGETGREVPVRATQAIKPPVPEDSQRELDAREREIRIMMATWM